MLASMILNRQYRAPNNHNSRIRAHTNHKYVVKYPRFYNKSGQAHLSDFILHCHDEVFYHRVNDSHNYKSLLYHHYLKNFFTVFKSHHYPSFQQNHLSSDCLKLVVLPQIKPKWSRSSYHFNNVTHDTKSILTHKIFGSRNQVGGPVYKIQTRIEG